MQKKQFFLLVSLIFLIYLNACVQEETSFNCQNGETYLVSRIIDGDTIETSTGEKIRFIGINTPEKKEACFEEAKKFLEKEILGKNVLIQGQEKDQYGRTLGRICLEKESINKKLLEEGLAHYYSIQEFPELKKLQEKAMQEKKGCLWRKGNENYFLENCIKLNKLEFKGNEFSGEYAEFFNDCNYSIDLNGFYLKDEATNLYFFPATKIKAKSFVRVYSGKGENTENEFFWGKGNVWNNNRDQLFLRNKKGILLVYYNYKNN